MIPARFHAKRTRRRVTRFARAMESVLRMHDHREGWWQKDYTAEEWFARLSEERDELLLALDKATSRWPHDRDYAATLAAMKECCDVANFAMMCFDKLVQRRNPEESDGCVLALDFDTETEAAR